MPHDDFSRYSRRGGFAALSCTFDFPGPWAVSIPTGRNGGVMFRVASLDEALQLVATHGFQLDVDEWTYARMVDEGAAPASRPEGAHKPPGHYPGNADEDFKRVGWPVFVRAKDLVGLTKADALKLAAERGLHPDIYDEHDRIRPLSLSPGRLKVEVRDGRVVSISVG